MEIHQYPINIKWDKDNIGTLSSPELQSSITVATPPQFEGGVAEIWSPEHLFTASVVSCFMTTFLAIASFSKFGFIDFQCGANGVLEKPDGKYKMTRVNLKAQLTISDQNQADKARRLLEKSEKACLISQSIQSEITLETEILFYSSKELV
ncbi:MAG: OsmC family protein [Saprospiraceae bacterium]|nr:OsmC family protein [Saprospiraceae bacterium]MBK7809705.1 OsmC family protein [Saprospiraceae bacterium]MBK9632185.1 OsmC family protein [Saprospiraceae bacterium]